jgi:hypothetical protein
MLKQLKYVRSGMAKVFHRMGTTPLKFQFELTVENVRLCQVSNEGALCVKWTRGPRSAQTPFVTSKTLTEVSEHVLKWDEHKPLILLSTLYENRNKTFQKKVSKVVIKSRERSSQKNVVIIALGIADLDLAACAAAKTTASFTLPLEKCTDRTASVTVSVTATRLSTKTGDLHDQHEGDQEEELSSLSGVEGDQSYHYEIAESSNDEASQLMLAELAGMAELDPSAVVARQQQVISYLQKRVGEREMKEDALQSHSQVLKLEAELEQAMTRTL